LVWSTTPLAIQWSGAEVGFLFGVTGRMLIGALVALTLCVLLGIGIVWDRSARRVYLAAGLGIYGAMLCVYWSAQHIPSGWISVLFGLSPVVTGLLARFIFRSESLGLHRVLGMLAGVAGLAVIFGSSLTLDLTMAFGVSGVLLAVLIHSASSLWVKRIDVDVPALALTSGGLLVAAPLFLVTWLWFDGVWPRNIPPSAGASIVYLGLFGSVLGFALYYYVLHRTEATRVALITLVTPVSALALGHLANGEPLTPQVLLGAALILSGLALFQLGDRWLTVSTTVGTTDREDLLSD
jgi:drug/metabolite transporter (DMT)-like permease